MKLLGHMHVKGLQWTGRVGRMIDNRIPKIMLEGKSWRKKDRRKTEEQMERRSEGRRHQITQYEKLTGSFKA